MPALHARKDSLCVCAGATASTASPSHYLYAALLFML